MKLKVRLFAPFDAQVRKRDLVVEVKSTRLPDVLRELGAQVPGLAEHLFVNEREGALTEHVNVFVNGVGVFHEELEGKTVREGDELLLMPPITGGRRRR